MFLRAWLSEEGGLTKLLYSLHPYFLVRHFAIRVYFVYCLWLKKSQMYLPPQKSINHPPN